MTAHIRFLAIFATIITQKADKNEKDSFITCSAHAVMPLCTG